MTTTTTANGSPAASPAPAPPVEQPAGAFQTEMIRQLRAIDSYGVQDGWSDSQVLEPLVLTKAMRREIPVVGDPDEEVVARLRAFYNAVAVRIEAGSGLMAVPFIHLSHEGFGRALVLVGKLVAVDRSLRDVHRFGFKSLEDMDEVGSKMVTRALVEIARHPGAAAA